MAAQNCVLAAKFLILKLKMCAADKYNKNTLSQLVDSSKKYFKKLNSSSCISYKEMKYFTYEHKKKNATYASFICYQRSIRDFLMCLEDQLFLIVESLLRRSLSSWTIILNLLCRRGYLM